MSRYDPRPWEAESLRDYIQYRVIQERMTYLGEATQRQAVALARMMTDFYPAKKDRILALNWLLSRKGNAEVNSTKHINAAEASVLINWIASNHLAAAQEAARVLVAASKDEGQMSLPGLGEP